jgi:hypothetical protein
MLSLWYKNKMFRVKVIFTNKVCTLDYICKYVCMCVCIYLHDWSLKERTELYVYNSESSDCHRSTQIAGGARWWIRSIHHLTLWIRRVRQYKRDYILKREREEKHWESWKRVKDSKKHGETKTKRKAANDSKFHPWFSKVVEGGCQILINKINQTSLMTDWQF